MIILIISAAKDEFYFIPFVPRLCEGLCGQASRERKDKYNIPCVPFNRGTDSFYNKSNAFFFYFVIVI